MGLDSSQKTCWCVTVRPKDLRLDGHGREVLTQLRYAGYEHIQAVHSSRLYFVDGRLQPSDIDLISKRLLADPVAEEYIVADQPIPPGAGRSAVTILPLPGVMNPAAMSTQTAVRALLTNLGHSGATVDALQTARRYELVAAADVDELEKMVSTVLANDCMERWCLDGFERSDPIVDVFRDPPDQPFKLRTVKLNGMDDGELDGLSRTGHLFLSTAEMRTIQQYFQRLERDPTDLELETLAQTWSEHCVHKTLKSAIDYEGEDFGKSGRISVHFENLLKDTIVRATTELDRDWCLSVFVDNAGVIAFDDEFAVAFKAETHNHPSAIEPYGGAATGTGGCIRDIMGCGLGAKPIASTDVFCLAPPDFDAKRLPGDVLHPRRVLRGVVGGVRDYGNRMGIPTVNGAIYFDERFLGNPLVFCGCVGLLPRNMVQKAPQPGDHIVVAGGRTGRDGIHGATFSSSELTDTHADEFSHAVQIGNPIEEKKVLDAQLIARDHADGCLYSSVTDCGAGGLSSAVGEMGETLGARVDLEKIPLKYAGLRYDEIWISEAQERMVFSVPPERLDSFLDVFAAEDVEATVIGSFTNDKTLRIYYRGESVGELGMDFLHNGLPTSTLKATWNGPRQDHDLRSRKCDAPPIRQSGNEKLLSELSKLNVASKEWVIRQYDHEVQGRTAVKPLMGPQHGPSDAAVMRPRYDSRRGIAVGCGLCPHVGDSDPYDMAVAAVDEALRNIICVGANPLRTAILDNFCWPKVDSEHSLGALVRACRGAYDVAIAYGLPFISGKDSLNNEFSMSEETARAAGLPSQLAIPYTLLISSLGIVDDVRRCVTLDLKKAGHALVIATAPCDSVGLGRAFDLHQKVARLIAEGLVFAAHDVSDGGLAVTIAEMCIASGLGADVEIDERHWSHALYSEVATSYVLEMEQSRAEECGLSIMGRVVAEPRLTLVAGDVEPVDVDVSVLADAWRKPLANGGA